MKFGTNSMLSAIGGRGLLTGLCCAGILALSQGCGQRHRDAPLQVMSFNIRYANPQDGVNAWSARKERVAATLQFERIDIAGLQEVLHSQLSDLKTLLPRYGWIGAGRDDGVQAGEYAPVCYRLDRFRLLETDHFWLSETPAVPGSMGWDAACPRMVTRGTFLDLHSGRSFHLLNTHFDHAGEGARQQSAALIVRHITTELTDLPVIVTGDFNCVRGTIAWQTLTGADSGLREASELCEAPLYGSSYTYNGFREEIRPGEQIDFIFVRDVGTVSRYGIIADRWDGAFVSDHHAVAAGLEL